jgi:hypothetical protein
MIKVENLNHELDRGSSSEILNIHGSNSSNTDKPGFETPISITH